MIKIAIVEDREDDSSHLKVLLDRYFEMSNAKYTILIFNSGEKFIENYSSGKFDIIFMDIFMDKLTGVDTAEKIRKTDKNCHIVFVTTDNSFAAESYRVKATDYIMKPIRTSDVTYIMDNILSSFIEPFISVELFEDLSVLRIKLDSIIYAEVKTRFTELHLITTTIEVKSDCISLLMNHNCFLECYRGIYVNMNHIKKALDNDFIIDTGESIPIRKRGCRSVKRAFLKYSVSRI